MKINQKIIGSFLALNIVLGGTAILSLSFMGRTQNDIQKTVKSEVIEGRFQIKIKDNFQKLEANLLTIILLKKDGIEIDTYQKQVDLLFIDIEEQINGALKNHRTNKKQLESEFRKNQLEKEQIEDQKEEIEDLELLKQKIVEYKSLVAQFQQLLETDRINEAQELWLTELQPKLSQEIAELSGEDSDASLAEVNETVNDISDQLSRHEKIIYSTCFIAVIISFFLARQISLSIVRPIDKLKDAALRLSSGDLDYEINIETKDEIGQLARCFKQIGNGLKENTVSKSYLTRILTAMKDSLIVTDLAGNIKTVNGVTCKLLQYSERELTKRKFQNCLIESSWWNDYLSESELPQNLQNKYITSKGQRIPINFSASFIYNESGDPCGLVFVARVLNPLISKISQKYVNDRHLI